MIDMGSIARRRLEHAGEHRRLGKVDVAGPTCRNRNRAAASDAVGAAAKIGAVEIELEDLRAWCSGSPR